MVGQHVLAYGFCTGRHLVLRNQPVSSYRPEVQTKRLYWSVSWLAGYRLLCVVCAWSTGMHVYANCSIEAVVLSVDGV